MKFMVCYDDSDIAKPLLCMAQKHAKVWNAKLEIIRIVTRTQPIKHDQVERMECEFANEIQKVIGEHDTPFNTQLLLTEQNSGEALVAFATEEKIDQMFIGIFKKSKVGKLVFGSSAQHIILHAPCPVLSINNESVNL